jgi:hypothetical protein
MSFNIDDFRSKANLNEGYLHTNKFKMLITPPAAMVGTDASQVARELEFYINTARIPGYTVVAGDYFRFGYGPAQKQAIRANFVPLQIMMDVSGNMKTLEFFEAWMQSTIPHDRGTTSAGISGGTSFGGADNSGQFSYDVSFRDEYVCDVRLQVFNQEGRKVKTYIFRETYPIDMNLPDMNWSKGSIQQAAIQLAYLDWQVLSGEQEDITNSIINAGDGITF